MKKKSQAEIFGVALIFVVLIFGVVFYSVWKSAHHSDVDSELRAQKYQKLVDSSLKAALGQSTGCYSERSRDSLEDLIRYCLIHSSSGGTADIYCKDYDLTKDACSFSITLINSTMFQLFNSTEFVSLPFVLTIDTPQNYYGRLHNITLTNFGYIYYNGKEVNKSNYKRMGFINKIHANPISIPSSQGNVLYELDIYYR